MDKKYTLNDVNRTIYTDSRSAYLRELMIKTMISAGRGHLASALSILEILRVLYDDVLNINPKSFKNRTCDRFILSKGHGCLALYVMLYEKKFFSMEELLSFCSAGSILAGHPEFPRVPGVEASTGSLGHGPAIGIGMALSLIKNGSDLNVYVLLGDGELGEGSVWEAALCATKHALSNLVFIIDYNKLQSYGPTEEVSCLEPLTEKWKSFGWGVLEIDGHNVMDIKTAIQGLPIIKNAPSVIICHTVKGAGIDIVEHNLEWHHKSRISAEEGESLMNAIRRSKVA